MSAPPGTIPPEMAPPPRSKSGKLADKLFNIRLTADELKRWKAAAGKQPLAAWLRAAAEAWLKRGGK